MSIRLNKVGNIPEAVSMPLSAKITFQTSPSAFIQKSAPPYMWPFNTEDLYDEHFRAYSNGVLGSSGSTLNYIGQGAGTLRRTTTDYFLPGFNLTPLFDPERDTPSLIGISSQIEIVTLSSEKLPQIFPLFIWTDQSGNNHLRIYGINALTPTTVARFTSGVSRSMLTVENTFEVSRISRNRMCDVYFGWYAARAVANMDSADCLFKDVNIAVSATSLKGNRQVFDPVMV